MIYLKYVLLTKDIHNTTWFGNTEFFLSSLAVIILLLFRSIMYDADKRNPLITIRKCNYYLKIQ